MKIKYFIIFFIVIGLFVSVYLFYKDINQKQGFCLTNFGCDLVLQSKYSRIFGLPLPLIGILYFLTLLFLINSQKLILFFKIASFSGFIFALYLIYIQAFVLRSFCQYCLVVDFSAIFIFILSLFLKKV